MSFNVDTNLLRNAVRMVHCIQKERGSSCAYYSDNRAFERAMMEAREKTNVAAGLIQHKDLPIARSLEKIRNLIETNKSRENSTDKTVLHRILVCFNTLTSSVIHECILKPLGRQDKTTIKNRHRRGLSSDLNDRLSSELIITPETIAHKTEPAPVLDSVKQPIGTRLQTLPSMDSDDENNNRALNPPPPPPPSAVPTDVPLSALRARSSSSDWAAASAASPSRKVNFLAGDGKDLRVQGLVDLLHTFVQLKESAGIERAILSSILTYKVKDVSFRMLTNDLLLQVENQRSLVTQLQQLPDGQYRSIVLDLAQLSPRLKELHNLILTDFDSIKNDGYDIRTLWEIITLYIDKLHSVELLIIEELECSQPLPLKRVASTNSIFTSGAIQQLIPPMIKNAMVKSPGTTNTNNLLLQEIFPAATEGGLHSLLQSTSADDIKKRLLEALSGRTDVPTASDADNNQHCAAASLNEGLNNALNDPMVPEENEDPASKEWEVSIYEIKFTRRIGQGASATTYLANWTGQEVAVKVASITQFGLEGWRTEVAALRRLHHPNIIRLMGSIFHKNPLTYCLVLEYCNAGDLNTALKYPTPRNFFFHVSISIAGAMSYLHSRNVIHRDLKPQNCLCHGNVASGNFTVKVTDFGVATDIGTDSNKNGSVMSGQSARRELTGETGTYRWMAPEVVRHEDYSIKADVYSFAIMLWQFVTHEEPFVEYSASEAAKLAAIDKERPPIPQGTPKAVADVITQNWSDKPTERCKFDVITETLQKIQTSVNADEKAFLEEPHGHPVYVYENPKLDSDNEADNKKKNGGKNGKHDLKRSSLLSHFFGAHKKSGKR